MTRTWLLARTFFARFFESELLPPGLPQAQLVIWGVAFLAAPGLLMPMQTAMIFSSLQHQPERLARLLLDNQLMFVTQNMLVMGLVALVLWPNVFPDRRDARLLGVLPIPARVVMTARLLALAALAAIFLAAINAIPILTYGPLVGYYGGAANVVLGGVAHAVTTTAAGAFVFFLLIAIQGGCLAMAGRRWAERTAVVWQLVFVAALLLQFGLLPRMRAAMGADLGAVAADPVWRWAPAFWFVGLGSIVGGAPGAGSGALAERAVVATGVVVGATFVVLTLAHGRLLRLALEGREPRRKRWAWLARLAGGLAALVNRRGVERATFGFLLRSLMRNGSHRMLMAIFAGVALTMVVATVGSAALRQGWSAFDRPRVPLLAVPLVVQFFLLVGARVVVGIPIEPKASWPFRLLEPADRAAAMRGVRNGLLLAIVVPLATLGGLFALVCWGAWTAAVHAAFCAALGWLLIEVLLWRLRQIPFTCPYAPGRMRLQLWPLYLFAFSLYSFTTTAIEAAVIDDPLRVALLLTAPLAASAALARWRARRLSGPPGLRFEYEDPDAIFAGFQLSEGLAARSRPQPVPVQPPP